MTHILRAALLSIVLVGPARAQERVGPPPRTAFALFRPAPAPFIHTAAPTPGPTYWLEGGIGGGIGLGLVTGGLFGAFCVNDDASQSCTGAILSGFGVGGAVGFIVGALVGGQFPKAEK